MLLVLYQMQERQNNMKTIITTMRDDNTKIDTFIDWCSKYFIPLPRGKKAKKKDLYCKYFATADFETTNDRELKEAFVYAWAFCFQGRVIIGRDMRSFNYFLERLSLSLKDLKLIVYWHNYSFDWSFESGYYHFKSDECFFTQPRKILYSMQYGNIENRCSYLLTGLNLANLTKQMNVKHAKKSGEKFDYSAYRTPYDGLKKYSIIYLRNDVRGLWEALLKFFEAENDTVYTIPFTKTGFVRRDMKEACKKIGYKTRMSWQLDYESYKACKEAFRGGNVHCNRRFASEGEIVENVDSNDYCSAYPSAMLSSDHFPKRNFYRKGPVSFEDAKEICSDGNCAIFRIRFTNIKLRNRDWGFPYISDSKCRNQVNTILDNGRILKASFLETTCTDLDLRIILFEYIFDNIEIYDSFFAKYGPLPDEIKEVIMKYFINKTELKDVEGQEVFYMNQKEKLNSTYGNTVMDPIQPVLEYLDDKQVYTDKIKRIKDDIKENKSTQQELEKEERELLEKYNKKGLLPFSIGVFVTSIARYELEKCLAILPVFSAVYIDTDSIKYTGVDPSIFDDYNNSIMKRDLELGLYADTITGKRKYLGLFELETAKGAYKKFTSLGAKKYCYIDHENKLHLTCAGVNKKKGVKELEESGGISQFKNGFIFRKSGGVTATYNDTTDKTIIKNGKPIEIRKNIYLEESTYTVGQTEDYLYIIDITMKAIKGQLDNPYDDWYNDCTN